MKKIIILINIIVSIICFFCSLIIFNSISFPFLGVGIILMGISLFLIVNHN